MADLARRVTAASCQKRKSPAQGGASFFTMRLGSRIVRPLLAFNFFQTVERGFVAQRFFDTNQLVVLSNTVRTAH